jgi:hypothetical protein
MSLLVELPALHRKPFRVAFAWGSLLLSAVLPMACGDSTTEAVPSLGTIEVTMLTDDIAMAPDSFQLFVNGGFSTSVGPADVHYLEYLPRGPHQIGLREEPENCRFTANPRVIVVTPGDTAYTTFQVFCR